MSEGSGIENQNLQIFLSEVKPIEESRNAMIMTRDEIRKYAEPPLVNACERFWDLNIRTLSSSANSKDVGDQAYIIIDYDSLSDQNKQISKESGELIENYDGMHAVKFLIPVNENTTADEIDKKTTEFAGKFEKQKATWIPSYTLQEMRGIYGIESDDEEYGLDWFRGGNFYYDPKGERFYLSEEHFKKANEIID